VCDDTHGTMEVAYRIASVDITAFRGIAGLTIDLPVGAPLYIIGANNAGKSTVVNAIALALRGGGFHAFSPELFDFFQSADGKPAKEFSIDLRFAAAGGVLPAVQGVGTPVDVHGLRVRGCVDKRGRMTHTHTLLGGDGKSITFSNRTALKGTTKERYEGQGVGWGPRNARLDDIRGVLPEVWLITPENLERSLYVWKTGPLAKLAELLSDRFLRDEWQFDYDGKSRKMPKTIELLHRFLRDAVTEFPFWKEDLGPKLQEALSRYVGRQAAISLRPDIQTIQDWLAQQLAASFASDSGGTITPLDRMGAGWQALVRVAALDVLGTYSEVLKDRVVLLFEEPETYLHPHLRRRLRDVLGELAAKGWVVVAATHSSEFVHFGATQQIQRLWRTGGSVVGGSLSASTVAKRTQLQAKLDEHGNHEFLFANRVIFVEGKDDLFAVRTVLQKRNEDLDGRSVSVVSVGGVENLPEYARLATQLKIPWCAITDEDIQDDGTVKPKTEQVRNTLANRATGFDLLLQWQNSLESVLGKATGKARPDWQAENIEPLSWPSLEQSHPAYASVRRAISAWMSAPPAVAG
jgi:ABC-type cobalamin transport system ATPase subunit